MVSEEQHKIKMVERVSVAKFDKTVEDDPVNPFVVVTQETITEVSLTDALILGWKPKDESVEASGTVQIQAGDSAGPRVGD